MLAEAYVYLSAKTARLERSQQDIQALARAHTCYCVPQVLFFPLNGFTDVLETCMKVDHVSLLSASIVTMLVQPLMKSQ